MNNQAVRRSAFNTESRYPARLERQHLACYRGWLQGLDLRELATLYLDGVDLRKAKALMAWIRQELILVAHRQGRERQAKILSRYASKTSFLYKATPTLEQYRQENDPDGFFTERELFTQYQRDYPEHEFEQERETSKLASLQVAIVLELEADLTAQPKPADALELWLSSATTRRLRARGLATLADVLQLMHSKGYRWWRQVPALGRSKASRLAAWLQANAETLGPLGAAVLEPVRSQAAEQLRRQAAFGFRPLESLRLPLALDGTDGSNRDALSPWEVDVDAVRAWLATKEAQPNTWRAYRREAERLLLWAAIEKEKALSSLAIEDVADYFDWLRALRPAATSWRWRVAAEAWFAPRRTPRWSEDWRPFEGALSAKSQLTARKIVVQLLKGLVRAGHLKRRPLPD